MENNTLNTRILNLQLITFLVVAILTAIVAVMFPVYARYIAMIGILLFLTVSGFITGWQWDNPENTVENKTAMRNSLINSLLAILVISVINIVKALAKSENSDLLILSMAIMMTAILLPFYLARVIHRWSMHHL